MIGKPEWFCPGEGSPAAGESLPKRAENAKYIFAVFSGRRIGHLVCHVVGARHLRPRNRGVGPGPQRPGCFACHVAGPGHLAAPLNGVGSRLTREQLEVALSRPRKAPSRRQNARATPIFRKVSARPCWISSSTLK